MAQKDVTAEEINELLDQGLSKKEAGEQLGISPQKVGSILKAADIAAFDEDESDEDNSAEIEPVVDVPKSVDILKGEVVNEKAPSTFAKTFSKGDITEHESITVFTAQEYTDYSKANGRFQGRKKGQKTKCSIEELRALINSGLKPQYIMNKHGIDEEEFKQLVWKLSKKELRGRPLKFDIKQDFIEVG